MQLCQKVEVAALVCATNTKVGTLAIGDGANDVAIIQRSHVSVDISGPVVMLYIRNLHHGHSNYKHMAFLLGTCSLKILWWC